MADEVKDGRLIVGFNPDDLRSEPVTMRWHRPTRVFRFVASDGTCAFDRYSHYIDISAIETLVIDLDARIEPPRTRRRIEVKRTPGRPGRRFVVRRGAALDTVVAALLTLA